MFAKLGVPAFTAPLTSSGSVKIQLCSGHAPPEKPVLERQLPSLSLKASASVDPISMWNWNVSGSREAGVRAAGEVIKSWTPTGFEKSTALPVGHPWNGPSQGFQGLCLCRWNSGSEPVVLRPFGKTLSPKMFAL